MPETDRSPARCGDCLRRRWLQCDGDFLSRTSSDERAFKLIGVEASRSMASIRASHSASLTAWAALASCMATAPICCRMPGWSGHRDPFRLRPGLDYPGRRAGTFAWLKDSGRAEYVTITDDEALQAFPRPVPLRRHHSRHSNPAHALAYAAKLAAKPGCQGQESCWSISPDEATRICTPSREKSGIQILNHVTASRQTFTAVCAAEGRKALIPFITAGDPEPAVDPAADAGAGRPAGCRHHRDSGCRFPDPMADGPDDPARLRACAGQGHDTAQGAGAWCVNSAPKDAATVPVVLMGYANPVEAYGRRGIRARDAASRWR